MSAAVPTSRLVDYFAIIGFDDSKERNGASVGKILQRFPGSDWPDVPFFQGLELFCQPQGWKICSKKLPPTFFISVLTDIGADRHYVACLSFYEPRFSSDNSSSLNDAEDDDEILNNSSIVGSSPDATIRSVVNSHSNLPVMYCPKCLVLVSRHEYFEVFRNCLGTIFTVYIDKLAYDFESLVSVLVSGIQVPPAGGPQVKFSLGANDRQAIQPPVSATVPVTQNCIAVLFQELGIFNVICLFSAVLTDRKILFISQSYTRLTDACHALSSLIFPLKYSYVYVPLLPGSLIEVLHSPTPFIMGLHSSFKSQVTDLFELITVDVDSGSVFIPDAITVPPLPEPYQSRLMTCLTLVLNRELFTADYAFASNANRNVPMHILDKQIRSCFLRLFADLFTDYRACLRVIRIHPKPFITFHKAAFMGLRCFQEDDFMSRLLDSMSFQSFVADRGVPYRVCDLFDEVYATIERTLQEENENTDKITDNIVMMAQQLQDNECPNNQPFLHKVPQPSEANMNNLVPPMFPHLDGEKINSIIEENVAKLPANLILNHNGGNQWCRAAQLREVPIVQKRSKYFKSQFSGNIRRLDVLKLCLRCIFENKISDARKMLSAVLLSMKSSVVRVAFCQEMYSSLHPQNRATLEAQQFDLIVRLMNCALQNDTPSDEYGVAYAMLSLSTTYCRRLSTGVMQFAYTCIQDHGVWKNQQFWEASFYHDVHMQLRDLYSVGDTKKSSALPFGSIPSRDVWNLYDEPCVLKLTADKIKSMSWLNDNELKEMRNQEEAIIYSQAIHYANRIVYFLVPMDANRLRRVNVQSLEDSSNASVSNVSRQSGDDLSTTESDVESGFIEGEGNGGDLGHGTVRYISKFLDKVCCEAGVSPDKLRQLHLMIPGVVAMHIETLEHVHKESKKLPPIHKPRMLVPAFLPGEQMLQGYLRVYLMPDGRSDLPKSAEKTHSNNFLPAEGAIFLTNYRIIFKGQPCDPYICDKVVMRVIPVMAVTKEKRIGQQFLSAVDQGGHYLHDALQVRSATFQLMKIAFDEEVSPDKVQNFCQALEQLRWPEEIGQMFALSFGNSTLSPCIANSALLPKDKSGTIKGIAKAAWKKTAKKAGFTKAKPKPSKLTLSTIGGPSSTTIKSSSIYGGHQPNSPKRMSPASDDESERQTPTHERPPGDFATLQSKLPLTRTLDRLSERSYCQDYQRLGLCTRVEVTLHTGGTLNKPLNRSGEGAFRLTVVNRSYAVCRSYPAVVAIPSKISDDSLKKIAKGHKHGRFPVVTWRSDREALLLRGAGFHVRSVVSRLKQQATYQSTSEHGVPQTAMKSSVEQERYFSNLVSMSPNLPLNSSSHLSSSMGSLLSLDSLLLANFDTASIGSSTPDTYRKPLSGVGQFQKAMGAMRSSGGMGQQKTMTMRFGLRPGHSRTNTLQASSATLNATPRLGLNQKRLSTVSTDIYGGYRDAGVTQALHRASLYIFGEKSQSKTLKLDPKCEFIPVDYPEAHDAKEALKKFLRVTAPSNPPSSGEASFVHLKVLDESGWLQQVKALLQISSAIVDIIDLQNSSVAVCLEYGWDATTQIVSLAQIMLDPYYRTLDGFRILIEKEWLSFGHRFSHRCNHTFASATSGFAPIFLQFLDVVHQIHNQYPSAFEFNDFYLRFLAYHSTAAYFRTFLMDCEADRVESGLIQFDSKPRPRLEMHSSEDTTGDSPLMKRNSLGRSAGPITSIWEYIAEKHRRSCIFYNFTYSPTARSKILRPQFSIASLDIWDYYLTDSLSHGSTYDLEVADTELLERQTDQSEMTDSTSFTNPTRRVVDANYDGVDFSQPNIFKSILDEVNGLERELDVLPQHWEQIILKIRQNLERNEEESAQISATGEWARWLGRAWHKKSTIELLLRGRLASRSGGQRASQTDNGEQHNFQKYNFTTPEHCHVCNRVLWGIMKQGLRCAVCEFSCHEKCASVAPQNCNVNRTFVVGGGSQKSPQNSASHLGGGTDNQSERLSENFDNFISPAVETRTHEGYLMKRGALLKAWKQRWFVLDSIKHQLRYYDAMEDSHCKGYIDLAEITGIGTATPPPGSPKQLDGAFFDLRTPRRVYNFLANNQRDAQEWIEKIQACLQ